MLDTVVIFGEDVCYSVVFGTLVGMLAFVLCGLSCSGHLILVVLCGH